VTRLHLDGETASVIDLKKRGLDVYMKDPSTRVLMVSWAFDDDDLELWEPQDGPLPREVQKALLSPAVEKWAFNAAFERWMTRYLLKLDTPTKGWRCTMALAYMFSFFGGLDMVGDQMDMPEDKKKMKEGTRLVRKFTMPQRITKNQPHLWRTEETDPDDWEIFREYCKQDTGAERAQMHRLMRYPVQQEEWEIYELDQIINDRGLPIDRRFVDNARIMAARRKAELALQLNGITGLGNSNSVSQLLPFLQARGYPFADLQKDTLNKVYNETEESFGAWTERRGKRLSIDDAETPAVASQIESAHRNGIIPIDSTAVRVIQVREYASKMSTAKYSAVAERLSGDNRIRHSFQYGGASRSRRWAGRGWQTHNLPRTPKMLDKLWLLTLATDLIRENRYEEIDLHFDEPMDLLSGCIRSSIRADDDEELRVCDLASIETIGLAWLSRNVRTIRSFADGLDPYKDFGRDWLKKPYEDITSAERTICKPAVLGAGYGLGGGKLVEGKKTGLWGYAENMGVRMTKEESLSSVTTWRDLNAPTVDWWDELEDGWVKALRFPGRRFYAREVSFEYRKPFMIIWLPGERPMYYKDPKVSWVKHISASGKSYQRRQLHYQGKLQNKAIWGTVYTHGGKLAENITQAVCRDILADCLLRLHRAGFYLVGHVHDEGICEEDRNDKIHTWEKMREIFSQPIARYPGFPIRAAGYAAQFYRKD
jgi:DNA polymerase bacteriophage-type